MTRTDESSSRARLVAVLCAQYALLGSALRMVDETGVLAEQVEGRAWHDEAWSSSFHEAAVAEEAGRPSCQEVIPNGDRRSSAYRRLRPCKCAEGFVVRGDDPECEPYREQRYYRRSLTPGKCQCVTLSALCGPGVFLQVTHQPQLGVKHWPVPAPHAVTFASFTHWGGCSKHYALVCQQGVASVEVTMACPDTYQTVDAADLPGRPGPFINDWELCTSKLGKVTLLQTVVDEVWGADMTSGTEVKGCLRLASPSLLPRLNGMRGEMEEQRTSLSSLKAQFGGCPQFTTDKQRIARGRDFDTIGLGWWMKQMQKGARLRARIFSGKRKWFDWARVRYSNTFNLLFVKIGVEENRSKSFRSLAHANCGEPTPFVGGPLVFRHAQVSQQLLSKTQQRTYAFATIKSTEKCFQKNFIVFLSSGSPEHTQARALIDEAGWDKLTLPTEYTFSKEPDKKVPSTMTVGAEVTPLLMRALWGSEPDKKTLSYVLPYLKNGPLCILGSVAEQLWLLPTRKIRNTRKYMFDFVKASPRAKTMVDLLHDGKYPAVRSVHSYNGDEPADTFLQNMADLTALSGIMGVTHMTLKCVEYQWRDPAHVKLYRKDKTAYLHELMRLDGSVTSFTTAMPEETKMTLEGREVTFPAGNPQQMIIGAANRDATVFANPDRFDPERPEAPENLSWNGRLADVIARNYSAAPRLCPGYSLSMEIAEAVCTHFTKNLGVEAE